MEGNKIFLSEQMISYIKRTRKDLGISAYKLSVECGQNKYRINNIENGRTKSISEESALKIFETLDAIEHDLMFDDFLRKIESGEADASSGFFGDDEVDDEYLEGRTLSF